MIEYEKYSKLVSKSAVEKLISENNIDVSAITQIITISCTGFYAPGIDYYLINEFNIPDFVKRINIGFMGCAASIIGFNTVLNTMNNEKNKEVNTLLV